MKNILKVLNKYEAKSAHQNLPIIWKNAKNDVVSDFSGKGYIDFSSGIFVTNIGHCGVSKAILEQVGNDLTYSYSFPTEIRAKYVRELCKFTGFEKAFLLSSGSEAVDCAVKIMKLNRLNKTFIFSFEGAMHGKTALGEALKGFRYSSWVDINYILSMSPFEPTVFHIEQIKGYGIAGIIIESYQGWSGRFYDKKYIQKLVEQCKKNKILVCFDEVQGGFGRTGKKFAYQHYGVEPDLLVLGKAIGNGFPLSAVVGRAELLDTPNDLSSTYSGNPLACACGLEVIKQIKEKKLINKAREKGKYLKYCLNCLKKAFKIDYHCKGLMGALIFKDKKTADKICVEAMKQGLILVKTGRESVKIGMPLTITKKNLYEGFDILLNVLEEVLDNK